MYNFWCFFSPKCPYEISVNNNRATPVRKTPYRHRTATECAIVSMYQLWRHSRTDNSRCRRSQGWDQPPVCQQGRHIRICHSLWLIPVSQAVLLMSLFRVHALPIESAGSVRRRATVSSATWYAVLCVKKWIRRPPARRLYSIAQTRNLETKNEN